jgi:hypothetical protein
VTPVSGVGYRRHGDRVVTAAVSRLPEPKPKKKAATPAAARKAEAGDGYVTVEQCGMELRIPVGDNVPFAATLRFMGLNDDLTPLAQRERKPARDQASAWP